MPNFPGVRELRNVIIMLVFEGKREIKHHRMEMQWYKGLTLYFHKLTFSSVQFSCSVVSNSLRPHESQHARPPFPSPSPGVHSNSRPSSQWCHPAISSSVVPFSSCPQSLPASESFQMSQLLAWGGQSIGVSTLASVLPKNTQDWCPLGWTVWSPCSPRDSQESSPTPHFKASIPWCSAFFTVQLSHPYMTTGKTIALTRQIFVGKVISLLCNMLSRLVITFLPRSKRLLISWLQSPSAVLWSPPKIKCDTVSLSNSHEVMGPGAMIFVFRMLSFKLFHSPLSLSTRGFWVPLHFLP